jgi:DNA (cytosine-5)-methyltransferase 3A
MFGGSPCTDFSFAGRARGMVTTDKIEITDLETYLKLKSEGFEFVGQSYLFWEYVRILKEVKPKYFLLENVKMSEKWKKVITDTLGVEPIKIDSRLVSAQKRQRLYWTNIPNVTVPIDRGITIKDILMDRNDSRFDLEVPTQKRIAYMERRAKRGFLNKLYLTKDTEKSECIVATVYKNMREFVYQDENGLRFLTDIELERLQTVPDNYSNCVSKTQRRKMLGNGWTVDVISHIFSYLPKNI